MKCPYCAEDIRDEAILCRFCGATKTTAGWKAPVVPPPVPPQPAMAPARKANFTIRTAAVFFLLSAAFEIPSLTSPVPLFGAVRGGMAAALYHALYCALFVAMGVGLWKATVWGYKLMWAGTIFYSLDKLLYLLDHHARVAELNQQLQSLGAMDLVDPNTLIGYMNLVTLLTVTCWWGFILYLYYKRSYFAPPPPAD